MKPPDVLLVVLDCVRRDARDPDGPIRARMPVLDGLERRGTSFQRAVSTSHWSLPSHASLLTGQYPWEHQMFRGSTLSLAHDRPTIAERFRAAGFRTALFSSNPFLSPLTGLDRGFEYGAWGQFSDCFRRFQARPLPSGRFGDEANGDGHARWEDDAEPAYVRETLRTLATRFPLAPELFFQAGRLRGGRRFWGEAPRVAGWLEPELQGWLARRSRDEPLFCALNILDAHEPYFGVLPMGRVSPIEWLRSYAGPLDRTDWRRGRAAPSIESVRRIARLYRASVELTDRRLGTIIEIMRNRVGTRGLSVAIVADHGQALGEEGHMYHVRGTTTSLLRVPMVLGPSTDIGPLRIDEWTSIKDALPRLVAADDDLASVAEVGSDGAPPAMDPSAGFAAAVVDGPPSDVGASEGFAASEIDDHWVAVYSGSVKYQVKVANGTGMKYDLTPGNDPQTPVRMTQEDFDSNLGRSASEIRERVRILLGRGPFGLAADRLRSWGY